MNPQTSALRMGRFMTTVKYILLILGAFIVFFPFLWMLTTSLKTVGGIWLRFRAISGTPF